MPSHEKIRLVVTCPEETKSLLMQELELLGAEDIEPSYRAVLCAVDEATFYQLHLDLRTASRILLVIKEFAAATPNMLHDQAKRVKWEKYFGINDTFLVEGVAGDRGPDAMGSNDISKKVREAIQLVFKTKTGQFPKVDLEEPKARVVAFIRDKRCILSIDTSGRSLHKRGYRLEGHPAPLKETMASSILLLSGYDGSQTLWDPMCGSGTIPIEAAFISLGKAAQIHRKKGDFGFETLRIFNRELWRKIQDQTRNRRKAEPSQPIYASDINPQYVALAREIALRARVEKHITFEAKDFFSSQPPAPEGIVIMNMPYGTRIGSAEQLQEFYKKTGDYLKQQFSGWRAALLVAEESPYKFIGLKPDRKFSLLNGSIKTKLLIFNIYKGTKRKSS